jgi:hypothetical protein
MQFGHDRLSLDSAVVKTKHFYAVKGIIGKIGDILSTLLAAKQPVRAVPRETCQGTFRITGNARSIATRADAGWIQRRLDRLDQTGKSRVLLPTV